MEPRERQDIRNSQPPFTALTSRQATLCTLVEHRTNVFLGEKYEMKKEIKFSVTDRSSALSLLHARTHAHARVHTHTHARTHTRTHATFSAVAFLYTHTHVLRDALWTLLEESALKRHRKWPRNRSIRLIWYFLYSKTRIRGFCETKSGDYWSPGPKSPSSLAGWVPVHPVGHRTSPMMPLLNVLPGFIFLGCELQ